ncbi:MAG: histidine phosphatase family protein [Bacillota bacterium]
MVAPRPDRDRPPARARASFRRVLKAFAGLEEKIIAGRLGPRALLVTHGWVIKVICAHVLGLPWSNKLQSYPSDLTSLHRLRRSGASGA